MPRMMVMLIIDPAIHQYLRVQGCRLESRYTSLDMLCPSAAPLNWEIVIRSIHSWTWLCCLTTFIAPLLVTGHYDRRIFCTYVLQFLARIMSSKDVGRRRGSFVTISK